MFNFMSLFKSTWVRNHRNGWAQWFTLEIPALGAQGGQITRSGVRDQPSQHSEILSLLKTQKISWAWWWVPIILATRKLEAGESLEPGRQRLQCAQICHYTPAWQQRDLFQKEGRGREVLETSHWSPKLPVPWSS